MMCHLKVTHHISKKRREFKMRKKLLFGILLGAMATSLMACGGSEPTTTSDTPTEMSSEDLSSSEENDVDVIAEAEEQDAEEGSTGAGSSEEDSSEVETTSEDTSSEADSSSEDIEDPGTHSEQ